ncbi:MAG: DUF721 domain-containing protein [Prevotellaceae bacterium]|jgi:hypothetical protein|nr:DUF721 domain-containing protein [Prevotellaceae bacterium]
MIRKTPTAISNKIILNSLKTEFGDEIYFRYLESRLIFQIIPKVFGETLYAYLSDVKLENQVLYIRVSSAPLRSNLLMQRENLIQRLNEENGIKLVKNIHFR